MFSCMLLCSNALLQCSIPLPICVHHGCRQWWSRGGFCPPIFSQLYIYYLNGAVPVTMKELPKYRPVGTSFRLRHYVLCFNEWCTHVFKVGVASEKCVWPPEFSGVLHAPYLLAPPPSLKTYLCMCYVWV